MGEYSELFVVFDVAKKKHAVAIAEGGRRGEIRFVGEIENSPATTERMIKKLAASLRSAPCLLRSRSNLL
jgi:transposase